MAHLISPLAKAMGCAPPVNPSLMCSLSHITITSLQHDLCYHKTVHSLFTVPCGHGCTNDMQPLLDQ